MRYPGRWLLAAVLGGIPACFNCPDSDIEYRSAEASAPIPVPNTLHEHVVAVRASESRSPRSQQLYLGITSVDLRWHVRTVRLVEFGGQERPLFELPVGLPPDEAAAAVAVEVNDTAPVTGSFEGLVELLMANRVAVEITADLPGMERMLVPLRLKQSADWHELSCGT